MNISKNKVIWRHPTGHVENQVGHILATRGIDIKANDTRTYKGATAHTDHSLVIVKILNLHIPKEYKTKRNIKRWNIETLKYEGTRKKYEALRTDKMENQITCGTENQWKQMKNAIIKTAGKKNLARMKWLTSRCYKNGISV